MSRRIAERFVLEREIGSGGMANVFLGKDAILDRLVAIKVLKPGHDDTDIGARFRREGRTAAGLSHPNIVQVYDAGEGEFEGRKASYIVMEYVPGGDLKALLDRKGRLSNEDLARLGAGVSAGLAHAHERGVIHRDIKPHNVLLDDYGRPKLTDFGIARALDATQATKTGSYLGTALYSSPEQLRGEKVTPKSDVYSLGVAFYQTATGETPFTGSPLTVAHQHVSDLPTPPRELNGSVSEDLDALILDCMAKDPDRRPSADEVRIKLLEAGQGTYPTRAAAPPDPEPTPAPRRTRAAPPQAPPASPPAGARRESHRRRWPLLAAAALLLVVLGVTAAYATLGRDDPNTAGNPPGEQRAGQAEGGGQAGGDQGSGSEQQPEQDQPAQQEQPAQPAAPDPQGQQAQYAGSASAGGGQGDADSGDAGGDLSEEAAAQTVEQVYATADAGDFQASFDLLSQGFRDREPVTSPEDWSGTFAGVESITFEEGPDAQVSDDGTAAVTGVTIVRRTNGTGERNTANWSLVNEDGQWKFDGFNSLVPEEI